MAYYCCVAIESTPAPHLFNYGEGSTQIIRGNILEAVPRNVFYGHLLGFQASIFRQIQVCGVIIVMLAIL